MRESQKEIKNEKQRGEIERQRALERERKTEKLFHSTYVVENFFKDRKVLLL